MTRGVDQAPLSMEERLTILEQRFAAIEAGVAKSMERFTERSFNAGFDITQTDLYHLQIELREAAAGDVSNVQAPLPGVGRVRAADD